MMFELSDEKLEALEKIVGGKVYSVYYDPAHLKYDVGFERDKLLQQKEVSKDSLDDVMAGRINLDGLRRD